MWKYFLWCLRFIILYIPDDTHPLMGFPGGASDKESSCLCRRYKRHCSVPGSRRSPGRGDSNPLKYSCLENLMDREDWQVTVHSVTKSQTWLKRFSMHTSPLSFLLPTLACYSSAQHFRSQVRWWTATHSASCPPPQSLWLPLSSVSPRGVCTT